MSDMKTPGVYVVEKNAFPNSVVEVPTAIPAFIGFTKKAENGSQSLLNVPFRISSMVEYEEHFGGAMQCDLIDKNLLIKFFAKNFSDTVPDDFVTNGGTKADYEALVGCKKGYIAGLDKIERKLEDSSYILQLFSLYQHIRFFFANGGGSCYIVSIGGNKGTIESKKFKAGMIALERESEPTLLVIPEAVNMIEADCYAIYQQMLSHCGKMKNRFAILDVHDGFKSGNGMIDNFRNQIGTNHLSFGSSYYPWLHTSISDISTIKEDLNIDSILYLFIQNETITKTDDDSHKLHCFLLHYFYNIIDDDISTVYDKASLKQVVCCLVGGKDKETLAEVAKDTTGATVFQKINKAAKVTLSELSKAEKNALAAKWWKVGNHDSKNFLKKLCKVINLLPPSAAMAGLYTMVDNTRGVWKAPANVSLNLVTSPAVDITDEEQKDLNVSESGKSINAIRNFIGFGTRVWGARTLDGNKPDLKYINVRRTMIFLEESIKSAARSYVFEPNDANTWLNMKCMIENFLRDVWKRGGLAGASPEEAFSVHIGLGETMTSDDILKGVMRVTVMVAISHPAEFIEITFQQQMQKN